MVHFKSVAMTVSIATSKDKSRSQLHPVFKLEECVDGEHSVPPHLLAASGNLDALQASIKAFNITLRERDQEDATLLHYAARASQLSVLQFLVKEGVELDAVDKFGNTAMHLSAAVSHSEGIAHLIESGASCAVPNNETNLPVHIACKDLTGKSLRSCLFHSKLSCNLLVQGYDGRNALHVLAELDNIEGTKVFLEFMAVKQVNIECGRSACELKDAYGFTPIHLAARRNSYRVLEFLINKWKEKGKSLQELFELLDEVNSTPLHVAVGEGHFEVACLLLKYGACPCVNKEDISPPLHLACSLGRLDIVKSMVEHSGAEIFHQLDQYQRTSLHYSALSIHSTSIIGYIIDEGGPEIDVDHQDSKGRTPLHVSISSGNLACTRELLARGADPFLKDKAGSNVLHLAVLHDRKPIIGDLLAIPDAYHLLTDINAKGFSPVHIGLKLGLEEVMLALMSYIRGQCQSRQCMFVKDLNGNSYVHLAAASGEFRSLVEFLDVPNSLKLLNETNHYGRTPLHSAAKRGQTRCVEHLLNRGAMVHKSKGLTPFMLACSGGHIACAKLLYKAHPFQIDWEDEFGNTALHHASHSRSPPMVQYVLDVNAKITHNDSGKSFLDVIIHNKDEECGLAVVNHRRWQGCLDLVSPTGETNMLNLIKKMPSISKAVLDRCYTKKSLPQGRGYSEVFKFKYLLSLEDSKMEDENHDSSYLSSNPPPLNRRKSVNKLLSIEFDPSDEGNMSIVRYRRSLKHNIVTETTKKKVSQTMEVLTAMIRYRRVELLVHPVVMEYMKIKWTSYGMFCFSVGWLFYFMQVLSLSAFVIFGSSASTGASQNMSNENSTITNSSARVSVNSTGEVLRWIAMSFNTLLVVIVALSVFVMRHHFYRSYSGFIQLMDGVWSIIFTSVFLLSPEPFGDKSVVVGAAACFFSWIVVFSYLRLLDSFGIYVTMFFTILHRVAIVLVICTFLLLAFALPLFLLGRDLKEFSSIGFSLFSVFGYMLGEVQYSLFVENTGSHSAILILIVTFLAIMLSIVMANLLIGLAVGDIEQIKLNSLYDKMKVEVTFFCAVDENLPRFLHQKMLSLFIYPSGKTEPKYQYCKIVGGCKHKWWGKGWLRLKFMRHGILDMADKEEAESEERHMIDPPLDMKSEIVQIRQKLQDITDAMHALQVSKDRRNRCCRSLQLQMSSSSLGSDNCYDFSDPFYDTMP